ncbi:MAG: ureidoglycolate lyase [Myxococcota bacterium]
METTKENVTVLPARHATPESFAPYGLVLTGRDEGLHGPEDQWLDLSAGRPRVYILRLRQRGRAFREIARHCLVTQCLGSVGGRPWWMAVAPPRDLEDPSATPDPDEIVAFDIPGDVLILLKRGTWHAGPYFLEPEQQFFDLELADTNEVDLQVVDLAESFGRVFEFG